MLGGRTAEALALGEVSSGAESDLEQATALARRMISRWGMNGKIGPVAYHREQEYPFLGRTMAQPPDFSEDTAWMIDQEVRALVQSLAERAKQVLTENRAALEAVARELAEKEMLEAAEIRRLIESQHAEAPTSRAHIA
jgi:cell division protease FtsH